MTDPADPDLAAELAARAEALAEERVAVAAYVGHGPSRAALGADAPRQPPTVDAWILGLADWDMAFVPLAGLSCAGLALEALERARPDAALPWRQRFELARAFVEEPGYERAVALVQATRDGPRASDDDDAPAAAMRAVEHGAALALNALATRYLADVAPLLTALVASTVAAGVPVATVVEAVGGTICAAVLGQPAD